MTSPNGPPPPKLASQRLKAVTYVSACKVCRHTRAPQLKLDTAHPHHHQCSTCCWHECKYTDDRAKFSHTRAAVHNEQTWPAGFSDDLGPVAAHLGRQVVSLRGRLALLPCCHILQLPNVQEDLVILQWHLHKYTMHKQPHTYAASYVAAMRSSQSLYTNRHNQSTCC